jgi:nucleotide-binding universal stress UspA family protein
VAWHEFHIRDVILVGVSLRGDDAAPLAFAAALAGHTGAPLVLVHAYAYEPLIAIPPPQWEHDLRERTMEGLEDLAAPLRGRLSVTLEVRASPSPVRALHEAAEEHGASVLVAGARRGHTLPGGVGERLLHAAPCAVALVPGEYPVRPWGLRRIGVAFVDGPEGEDALALAAGIARDCGGRVSSFTVAAREPPAPESARVDEILAKVRASVPGDLLEATELLVGDPAEELIGVSAGLDLLVCGSRGYGPVRSLILGGVSRSLAHAAACPVLVVPRGPVPGVRGAGGVG